MSELQSQQVSADPRSLTIPELDRSLASLATMAELKPEFGYVLAVATASTIV